MPRINWHKIGVGIIVPLILIVIWQLFSSLGLVNKHILPSPYSVLNRWVIYLLPKKTYVDSGLGYFSWIFSGELIEDILNSMFRVISGFVIGAGIALPLGLLMGKSKKIYAYIDPLIQILRPIPPIAYIPLAILWFGLGNPPAIFLISIGAFFPILINTIAGVRNVDGIYIRAARNLGANQLTMFIRIILPAAIPYILSGVRIGIGTSFIVVIVAEMIAVNNGLGFRILEAREYFWSDKIIAGMLSIGFLGLSIDLVVTKLNNYLLRWHRGLDN
jgi:NitT/TauT family transport system permease protein